VDDVPVIKIQNHKIHRQSDCSKFSKPAFSNCGPMKKDIGLYQRYAGEGRRSVLKLYVDTGNV